MTSPRPSVASTLACTRCGGIVSLDGSTPRIRCPYCAHEQDVPPERLAQLASYQRSAGDLVRRVEVEEGQRAQWERWYGADGKSKKGYLASFAIFGAMAIVYAAAMLLLSAHVIREETLARVLPIGIFGVFVVGMVAVTARYTRREKRAASSLPHVAAQCPRCGGALAFEAGRVTERCGHCGASLVAGATVQREAIDLARADLRRASMARYRVERNAMSNVYRASAASVMPYVVLGSFLPMTGGIAVAISISSSTSDEPAPPIGAIACVWLMALANASAIAVVFLVRQARKNRWRAVAHAVAARIDGRVSTTVGEWLVWLNAFWIAPYPVQNFLVGPSFHAVTGRLSAYDVAVDLEPMPPSPQYTSSRLDVLLAASLPGNAESVPAPPDVAARAHALGFALSSCAAGLVASGGVALRHAKKREPMAVAEDITSVAALLVDWAMRAGAATSAPIV